MVTVTGAFADEISARTDTYLQQVETTTAHLPDAVDAYGDPETQDVEVHKLREDLEWTDSRAALVDEELHEVAARDATNTRWTPRTSTR